MSDQVHEPTRHEPEDRRVTQSGRRSGVTAVEANHAGVDLSHEGDRTAQFDATSGSVTSAQPEAPQEDAVGDTAEFARPAPQEDATKQTRSGATISQRLGASGYATGIWIGLALAMAALGAIFYTWSEVAALTNVAQQMPYLVSGAILGLVLIIAAATVVDVTVRRRDSKARTAQLAQITAAIAELRQLLQDTSDQREAE